MNIQGPSNIHGVQGVQGPHSAGRYQSSQSAPPTAPPTAAPADQLDISPAAEAAAQAVEGGGIRADLVARVRSEIASGTYETADKLSAALDGLLNEIG